MNVLEYLRQLNDGLFINHILMVKRDVFSDIIKDNISDEFICPIPLSLGKQLFIGKESKKSVIIDFSTNPRTIIIIDAEDLDQDDSYLVLKYGKILNEGIRIWS